MMYCTKDDPCQIQGIDCERCDFNNAWNGDETKKDINIILQRIKDGTIIHKEVCPWCKTAEHLYVHTYATTTDEEDAVGVYSVCTIRCSQCGCAGPTFEVTDGWRKDRDIANGWQMWNEWRE